MAKIFEDQVRNIIRGATLLGGGGGGSMKSGINMLENYKKHSGKKIEVEVINVDEMEDNTYAAVTAGMGAPTKIPEDFTPWLREAYDLYVNTAAYRGKEVKYSMAVELGGFNTFVPMLVAMEKEIPFLNLDGAARAVPALTTLLLNVNGYDTFPLALAGKLSGDEKFNYVTYDFIGETAKNAALGEDLARSVLTTTMEQICGLSGWLTKKETLIETGGLPEGSIDFSETVGNILETNRPEDVYDAINATQITEAHDLGTFDVIDGKTGAGAGFDNGSITFGREDGMSFAKIDFQNENLVISTGKSLDSVKPIMTAPDIICAFEISNDGNTPLTNSDFFDEDSKIIKPRKVRLGLIKVDDVWWKEPISKLNEIWGEYFKNVDYTGEIIKFKK